MPLAVWPVAAKKEVGVPVRGRAVLLFRSKNC